MAEESFSHAEAATQIAQALGIEQDAAEKLVNEGMGNGESGILKCIYPPGEPRYHKVGGTSFVATPRVTATSLRSYIAMLKFDGRGRPRGSKTDETDKALARVANRLVNDGHFKTIAKATRFVSSEAPGQNTEPASKEKRVRAWRKIDK